MADPGDKSILLDIPNNDESTDPATLSKLNEPIRAAYRALRALDPTHAAFGPADDHLLSIANQLGPAFEYARYGIDAEFGPFVSWRGVSGPQWAIQVLVVATDERAAGAIEAVNKWGRLGEPVDPEDLTTYVLDDEQEWGDSSLDRAGRAYRRDCGWDFSPGQSGVYLLAVAPYTSMSFGDDDMCYGNIAGFTIVHDRDDDGVYESLAHLWVAKAWRRRGVAAGLLRVARGRFPISRVEGPVTDDGLALIKASAPDLISNAD
jgi:GNAT superfamily N-acetyltransferase